MLQSIFGALLALVFLGLAPSKLGEKFLNHHLERKLSALKHDQNEQIEKLKTKLAHLGDRGVRSNEREFRAIEAAWEHFLDAYGATMQCAIAYMQHPDFQGLSDIEARQYLESSDLSDRQRQAVMSEANRNKAFSRFIEINQISKAGLAIYNARNLIGKQAIFIPDDLLASFEAMMKRLSAAQIQRSIEPQYGASGLNDATWLITNGESERTSLLAAVRERISGYSG
ncbi:MAG TPA: hypothetical protein VMU82_12615 [Acetobacteraceae bacterium]|nr:hypothetical protein [Acetobacteraceae bacterium]